MTPADCRFETAVLEEIEADRWPSSSPAELRAHVETCPVCADVALVAAEMRAADGAPTAPLILPSAGQVWWRAELRARQEKAQLVQRPMLAVQVVAAVVALLGFATALRWLAPNAWGWLVQTAGMARTTDGVGSWGLLLILSIGFWLVLAPLAVYMVVRADRQGGR
jgi:hypothetical protein